MTDRSGALTQEIIGVGKRLYDAGLAVARSGNISARLQGETILITATGTFLGSLVPGDIVAVDLVKNAPAGVKLPSSELPLHSLVYKHFPAKTVIHCHPPLINGYFAACDSLKALTFETKFYLGEVPVVPQDTPTVTNPEPVIEALRRNNLVVLRNHGAVAIADTFQEGVSLIEALEEAVKVAAVARLFKKDILDDLDSGLKENLTRKDAVYEMFSKEHIQAIVDLVNKDAFIAEKGKALDLTVQLAVTLEGTNKAYKFNFEKGRIIGLESNADAPFVISAPAAVWQQVFLGKLDSFVAVTQGKMNLKGQMGQLSKWYVPFTRLFALFKEVKISI
jgi:ribulose-5-phosphate 4-epimerase/fuculose-1-phosphate aldolase